MRLLQKASKMVTVLSGAAIGSVAVSAVDTAMTDVQLDKARLNHALVEGTATSRPTNESEYIDYCLRHAREGRYWAPQKHDFIDDFCFHVEDCYQTNPALFRCD